MKFQKLVKAEDGQIPEYNFNIPLERFQQYNLERLEELTTGIKDEFTKFVKTNKIEERECNKVLSSLAKVYRLLQHLNKYKN